MLIVRCKSHFCLYSFNFFFYLFYEIVNRIVEFSKKFLVVAAALFRCSFFFEKLRKPTKNPILSSGCLINEGLTVIDKKRKICFIFIKRPVSQVQPFAVDRKFQFFHCMIIRLEQLIPRIIFLIPLFFHFF